MSYPISSDLAAFAIVAVAPSDATDPTDPTDLTPVTPVAGRHAGAPAREGRHVSPATHATHAPRNVLKARRRELAPWLRAHGHAASGSGWNRATTVLDAFPWTGDDAGAREVMFTQALDAYLAS